MGVSGGGEAGMVTPPLSMMSKLSSSPDQYFSAAEFCWEDGGVGH